MEKKSVGHVIPRSGKVKQLSSDASALDNRNGHRNVTFTTTHLRKIFKKIF